MKHTTFLIVYSRDSEDRLENLRAVTDWLGNTGATIIVKELPADRPFHRTRAFNDLSREANTPVIVLSDADCIIDPIENLRLAEEEILSGMADFVWPFSSPNHSVPRSVHKEFLSGRRDLQEIKPIGCVSPLGGMVFCSREAYWKAGAENEAMIGWTPDDQERKCRWEKLGFRVANVPGKIFHLDHEITIGKNNPFYEAGEKEFQKIKSMSSDDLKDHVKKYFTWAKPYTDFL